MGYTAINGSNVVKMLLKGVNYSATLASLASLAAALYDIRAPIARARFASGKYLPNIHI
jgi:hypothetical protein